MEAYSKDLHTCTCTMYYGLNVEMPRYIIDDTSEWRLDGQDKQNKSQKTRADRQTNRPQYNHTQVDATPVGHVHVTLL